MTRVDTVVIRGAPGAHSRSAISALRRAASRSTTRSSGLRTATEIRQASPTGPVQMSSLSLNASSFPPVATSRSSPNPNPAMAMTPMGSRRRRHTRITAV